VPAERDRPRDSILVQRPDAVVGREEAGLVTAATAVVEQAGTARASTALPGVLADVPVAVLVIDRGAGAVTYANTAAVELAGNVRLPVDIDTWGASVGLTDLGGQPLASTSGPLSLVAQGLPVTGEAVRMASGPRADGPPAPDADARPDRLLWVTGFPLSRPDGDEHLSLVVFLEVEAGGADAAEDQLQALRERAVVATDIAFIITDPRQPDNPLIWVNPSFSRITGYGDEAVGRNCRFLQGPATDPAAIAGIRAALDERRAVTTTLLNYRKDGTAFWNQLSISPVFDGEGELVSFVGVQTDVTERVRGEREREAAFAAEQAARREAELARATAERARADAERMQGRLALMAEATSTLIATLDLTDLLDRLSRLCVPLLADWVFICLVDDDGAVRETASRHRDGLEEELRVLGTQHVGHLPESSPTRRSIATSRPVLVQQAGTRVDDLFSSEATRQAAERLGMRSLLAVPMVARRRTRGAILLARAHTERPFDQEDVDLAEDLARRAALAMDNVRLYQQEHTVADTLQRSLLPELPAIPGVESAAHYVSASTAADVGGDFYDLLHLPDGSIGVVIGDVVGHDIAAAAAMGHLRGLIRACAWEAPDPDPGVVLARVDRLVQGLGVASMATIVYARAVPPAGEGAPWRLTLASAGHPPPLLRTAGGEVEVLDEVTGLLIGVDGSRPRRSTSIDLPRDATLLAYTDGLIERPGTDLDEGIAELVDRLVATPAGSGPRALCDAAVAGSLDGRDDVAMIAVRFC
jgi:PAS domain S-box-containing protein